MGEAQVFFPEESPLLGLTEVGPMVGIHARASRRAHAAKWAVPSSLDSLEDGTFDGPRGVLVHRDVRFRVPIALALGIVAEVRVGDGE